MKTNLVCKYCQVEVEAVTEEKIFANKTKHISASCPLCKRWLKYLPQEENNDMMYFGKYKGKRMSEAVLTDPEYLHWLCEEVDNWDWSETKKTKIKNLIEKTFYDYNKKLSSPPDKLD